MAKSVSILNIVKSVVDHLNPENVMKMTKKISTLRARNVDELRVMARIIHKQALYKPDYAILYARLGASIVNGTENNRSEKRKNQKLFKTNLLRKCYNVLYLKGNQILRTLDDMPTFYSDLNKSKLDQYNFYLANCKFNAELYNQGVLPEKSMWALIADLLEENGDLQLHCLCTLLQVAGSKLSKTYSMAKAVAHLLILERDLFRETLMSTTLRPLIQEITDMYFNYWIHEDPDQSTTKGCRFKYRQETLSVQLMTEFVYSDCYDLLNDFVEETNSDGSKDILQQLSPIAQCMLKNDQISFVVSIICASLYENIQTRLKATNILVKLFKANHLSKMMVFLGFDKLHQDEEVNASSPKMKYLIDDIQDDFKYYIHV